MNSGIPSISCSCGARHPLHARYYVSVVDAGRTALVLGPYQTHQEALGRVAWAMWRVPEVFGAWTHFYAYGTVAMPATYTTSGRLTGEVV